MNGEQRKIVHEMIDKICEATGWKTPQDNRQPTYNELLDMLAEQSQHVVMLGNMNEYYQSWVTRLLKQIEYGKTLAGYNEQDCERFCENKS